MPAQLSSPMLPSYGMLPLFGSFSPGLPNHSPLRITRNSSRRRTSITNATSITWPSHLRRLDGSPLFLRLPMDDSTGKEFRRWLPNPALSNDAAAARFLLLARTALGEKSISHF